MKWNGINRTHVFVVVLILDLFWGVANVNLELLNGSARELTSLQHVSDLCIVKQCFLRKRDVQDESFSCNYITFIYIFMCMYVHIHMVHVYFYLCIYL